MNFTKLTNNLNELSKISSTLEKVSWLESHNDKDLLTFFSWYFDSSKITGIAEKKLTKACAISPSHSEDLFDLFKYFENHHTGSDCDVAYVLNSIPYICKSSEEVETFKKIICKNYPFGISEVTINKVYPNTVPTFDVMLAQSYFKLNESQKSKLFNGRTFNITEKCDGFRCIAIKESGNVRLVSRQGKLYEGCVDIEEALKTLPHDNFILDSEIIVSNRHTIPSTQQYKLTSNIVSSKGEKHGVTLNVFDFLTLDEWNSKECTHTYRERRSILELMLIDTTDSDPLYLLPIRYSGDSIEEALSYLGKARENNEEGVMLRFNDSMYEFKRSNQLLKMKVMSDMDVYIKGYERGSNKLSNTLGALICEVDHPTFGHLEMSVGSGFSDEERNLYWSMKDDIIGRVMEIQYFEVTENQSGSKSVRFPVHKCLKPEGTIPNN